MSRISGNVANGQPLQAGIPLDLIPILILLTGLLVLRSPGQVHRGVQVRPRRPEATLAPQLGRLAAPHQQVLLKSALVTWSATSAVAEGIGREIARTRRKCFSLQQQRTTRASTMLARKTCPETARTAVRSLLTTPIISIPTTLALGRLFPSSLAACC